jgi:hypothetical protein
MSFGNQRKKFVPRKLPCNSPKDFVGSAINGSFFFGWIEPKPAAALSDRAPYVLSSFSQRSFLYLKLAFFWFVN